MNKRALRHELRILKKVSYWWFFVAGVLFLFVAVLGLRANNQRMIDLRQAVFDADEQDGDVETALRNLRSHVYAHMNTDLSAGENPVKPPIQLKYRYERLVIQENAQLNENNETVYTDAQNFCEQKIATGFSGRNRLDCIREYVDANGATVQEVFIPEDLYKFDFISPRWSPDLAGLSIVAAILCLATALASYVSQQLIRKELRSHN